MKDMKEGLTSARKADTTHCRKSLAVYVARACEYGSAKYERANYARRATPEIVDLDAGTRADFERLRKYLRAAKDHIEDTLTSMERHQAGDPNLIDVEGMKRAAYAEDTDTKPGCPVGASGLPHLCHAAASLMMAIEQATHYGLLPADPGQPWAERKEPAETQPPRSGNPNCTDRLRGLDCLAWLEADVEPEQANRAADTFCRSCRKTYPADYIRWKELDEKNQKRRYPGGVGM